MSTLIEQLLAGEPCKPHSVCRDMSVAGGCTCKTAATVIEAMQDDMSAMADMLADADRRIAELEAGLRPFVDIAGQLEAARPGNGDNAWVLVFSSKGITHGDIRRARALLPEDSSNGG